MCRGYNGRPRADSPFHRFQVFLARALLVRSTLGIARLHKTHGGACSLLISYTIYGVPPALVDQSYEFSVPIEVRWCQGTVEAGCANARLDDRDG